jgi:hypothetical protein
MTHVPSTRKAPPSPSPAPWAVALFLASSGFAALSLLLVATGYMPS